MRFVIAGACGNAANCTKEPYARVADEAALAAVRDEAAREGDLELLSMHEDNLGGCSRKYVTWLANALERFPRATFIALADDDVYIQYEHLVGDLRRVRMAPGEPVLWGMIFWRGFYNAVTMSPDEKWGTMHSSDESAGKVRLKVEACRSALERQKASSPSSRVGGGSATAPGVPKPCTPSKIPQKLGEMVLRGEISTMAPTPMAMGPLFAVSRPLATMLAAPDSVAWRWMRAFKQTEVIRFARKKKSIPYVLKRAGCWPYGDAVFGIWVATLGQKVTMWHAPMGTSVLPAPWDPFGNSSIVLHGLKDNLTQHHWERAKRLGSGRYVPLRRECDTCAEMGWVAWPGSPYGSWRCCGVRQSKVRESWPRAASLKQ